MSTNPTITQLSQAQGNLDLRDRVDSELQAELTALADLDEDRLKRLDTYQAYYDGDHSLELTDRAREYLEATDVPFSENFAEVIVDALAERLVVETFTAQPIGEAFATEADALSILLSGWWGQPQVAELQAELHLLTMLLGECFLVTEWDEEHNRPRWVINRPERMKAVYDDHDPKTLQYAVKTWHSDDVGLERNPQGRRIQRLNIYRADRIERWFRATRDGGQWARWYDDANLDHLANPAQPEPTGWLIPWTTEMELDAEGEPVGDPIGNAVAHFRNRPLSRVQGQSEIHSDIPLQDAHNKLVVDLLMVADVQGWPQRYVTGAENLSAGDVKVTPGGVWRLGGKDAKAGQFPQADLAKLDAAIDSLLSRRARRSRTPLHLLMGGNLPSGESIKSAESGLVSKALNRQGNLTSPWLDAIMVSLRLGQAVSGITVPDLRGMIVAPVWRSPASRDEKNDAETAGKWHALGASAQTLLEQAGFDWETEQRQRQEENATNASAFESFMTSGGGTDQDAEDAPDESEGDDPDERDE